MPPRLPFLLRYRRVVVIAAAVLLGLTFVVRVNAESPGWSAADLLLLTSRLTALTLFLSAVWRSRRWREQRAFTVSIDQGAFVVPVLPNVILMAAAMAEIVGSTAGDMWSGSPAEPGGFNPIELVFCTGIGLLLLRTFVLIWRGDSLELHRDGLVVHAPLGVLRVPWEALRLGQPWRPEISAEALAIACDRPELIRWRGLGRSRWDSLRVGHVHPWFLADAIRFYVEYPEERAGIGTVEGHDRLLRVLSTLDTATPGSPAPGAVSPDAVAREER